METAPDTLGIIAGNRTLPLEFARLARAAGVRRLVVAAFENETDPALAALVDDIVTVTDQELVEAMLFAAGRMKMVVEPTGCLAIAAALNGRVALDGARVGLLVSGGNIDLLRFAELVSAAGPPG